MSSSLDTAINAKQRDAESNTDANDVEKHSLNKLRPWHYREGKDGGDSNEVSKG